jgi:nickel transport protein
MPAEVFVPIMSDRSLLESVVALALVLAPAVASAHGARVEAEVIQDVEVRRRIEVRATYHGGRPMAGAQVRVFSPGADDEPWLSGVCDDAGQFGFEPPPEMPGEWLVRVVHHGHGGVVTLGLPDLGAGGGADGSVVRAEASSAPHLSVLQRAVMGICVVWGLVGTALFFARGRS